MKNVGIIGGTGYTGGELARILSRHPGVSIAAMTSRQSAGRKVGSVQANLEGYVDIDFTESIPESTDLDLVFVATPHGASMDVTPGLLEKGIKASISQGITGSGMRQSMRSGTATSIRTQRIWHMRFTVSRSSTGRPFRGRSRRQPRMLCDLRHPGMRTSGEHGARRGQDIR